MSNSCKCHEGNPAYCSMEYQYAVKVVCGVVPECQPGEKHPPVAPGAYFTAINIRNTSGCERAVITWFVADAFNRPRFISAAQRLVLGPGEAVEIDCPEIMKAVGVQSPGFVKGFVTLESSVELDVVAVYTGTQGATWPLNTLHIERVPAKCVGVNQDLQLWVSTGVADWRSVSTGAPVVGVTPDSAWVQAPFGSSWADRDGSQAVGAETYRLEFDLCCGFRNPVLQMVVSTDNAGTVRFNGMTLLSLGSNAYQSLHAVTPPTNFVTGRNTLEITVDNQGTSPNPRGFVVGGLLQVQRGKCPCQELPYRRPRGGVAGESLGS